MKKKSARYRRVFRGCLPLLLGTIFLLSLISSLAVGTRAGYRAGENYRRAIVTELAELGLQEQYNLAAQDLAQGRYELARQRLEYILNQDPSYPQATARLAEALAVLYATGTPTPTLPPIPTITLTPTRDLRPVEELFAQAQLTWAAKDWDKAIDALLALRQSDPAYQTARVDGMLFMALRERGVDKIWKSGNLEGGIYDLALAARFAPLDAQAESARGLARLYIAGSSFWGVYPEEAIKYFSQVAAAAPGLHDASGVSAVQRYREALVQYAEQLAGAGNWCDAQEQYRAAYQQGAPVESVLREAMLRCSPPTNTPRPSTMPTATSQPQPPTTTQIPPTTAVPVEPTATMPPTGTAAPPPTEAPVVLPTDTPVPPSTDTPVQPPTETPVPPPTDTPVPPPADTPAPPPTNTQAPPTAAPPEPPTDTQAPPGESSPAASPVTGPLRSTLPAILLLAGGRP